MRIDYPWQGQVKLTIPETAGSTWQLRLRVPGWCPNAQVRLNGQPVEQPRLEAGYLLLERVWQPGDEVELTLALEPTLIEAHPRVDAVRDSLAIQRGSLVYCLEAADQPDVNLMEIQIDEKTPLQAVWREDLLPKGIMAIQAAGYVLGDEGWPGALYRPLNSSPRLSS
jgi:DUF1680 family protein